MPIIDDITSRPERIDGLKANIVNKLRSLKLNEMEWKLVQILESNLAPFYNHK